MSCISIKNFLFFIFLIKICNCVELLNMSPQKLDIRQGDNETIKFTYSGNLTYMNKLEITLNTSDSFLLLNPEHFVLSNSSIISVNIKGISITSRARINVANCSISNTTVQHTCPFDFKKIFVQVSVFHSKIIFWLIEITGWICFLAWSISFYPQIILNYQLKSVIGLNFDYLLLNIIGFVCYMIYNVMFYFDENIQNIYIATKSQNLLPVLLNDVVFSVHAVLACIVTTFQCFLYERGNQRISYVGRFWASFLLVFCLVTFVVTLFNVINPLQFINYLSYVKMAVTLSKYIPQGILNFKRKSTIGWSVGNVLLDFTGGFMNIFQMIFQAWNTDNWSAFYGNPVKFGLGLVSIFFDIFFMIQHYVLYRHFEEDTNYNQVETTDSTSPIPSNDSNNSKPTPS